MQQRENDPESAGSMAAYRIVAWCRLELSSVGIPVICSGSSGKTVFTKSIPTCPGSGTCIYDSGNSSVMADICHL